MKLLIVLVPLGIIITSLLIYTIIGEYKDWRRKKTWKNNLEYPPKTPINLFVVKHILHWKLEGDDFDMGEVACARERHRRILNGHLYIEPALVGIVVNTPEELETWKTKFKTLDDMKTWMKKQDELLTRYIKIKEGNFE